jgi:hypothetical protein
MQQLPSDGSHSDCLSDRLHGGQQGSVPGHPVPGGRDSRHHHLPGGQG